MEVDAPGGDGRDGPRERRGHSEAGRQNLDVRPQSGANGLPKHSYWLDLWLFILFDAVVFLFVYFLPCSLVKPMLSIFIATHTEKTILEEGEGRELRE
ncbi:HCV F-Transactivated Protein 1 [Saguinus oedipus]|uniref:HCV F-Transactivated Protein 1 n=1 Tax=Saguinus oedipus TaxID=9490 RepID=A0ABQ9W3F4_SAGOE|nr:HCV F-Transactivated Protein 1 [Saguinus oedipus]